MQPKYVVHEQPGILGCGYFFGTRYHVGHLGETVHKNSNTGLAIRLGYHGFHLSTCTNEPVGEDLCARCEAVVEKE